jgi:rod shape-determining protein MreC
MPINLDRQKDAHRLPMPLVAALCLLLSLLLLITWQLEGTNGPLHKIKAAAQVVAEPFQYIGSFVRMPFIGVGNALGDLSIGSDAIAALRSQNATLTQDNSKLQEYEAENARLEALLKMQSMYDLQTVGARIISTATDPYNQLITIDQGSNGGIKVGMPVMSASGLIGQVEEVTPTTATVRLATDAQSGISAMTQRARVDGVLTGSVNGQTDLSYVPVGKDVKVGDQVITSGLGGVYPKGILLGTVTAVSSGPTDLYEAVQVQLAGNLQGCEEVMVVTSAPAAVKADTNGTAADAS